MMRFIKWAILSLFICGSVVAASQTDSLNTLLQSELQLPSSSTTSDKTIVNFEKHLSAIPFDETIRDHRLRLSRIQYYLQQAKNYQQNGWYYNRNDAIERAENILEHHQSKLQKAYDHAYASL